jgi:hypothetical protein
MAHATDVPAKSLGFRTINSVQRALIKPPAFKLLLLNIAIHVSSKTGVAYPGLHLLATECSLSLSHTKRLLRIAKEAGILSVVLQGGGHSSNRYQFDLDALAKYIPEPALPIPAHVVERLREPMAEPGSPINPVQVRAGCQSTREPAAGSPMSTKPQRPQRPQSLGEGGRTTPSGSASPPPWVVPALPEQLDVNLFTQLVEMGPRKQARIDLLAQEAFDLDATGHDLNALATTTLKRGYKSWCKPPTATQRGHSHPSPKTAKSKIENPANPNGWGGY